MQANRNQYGFKEHSFGNYFIDSKYGKRLNCTELTLQSRIKPESGIIELDSGLNTNSEFYDKYVGEDLALADPPKQNSKDKVKRFVYNFSLAYFIS